MRSKFMKYRERDASDCIPLPAKIANKVQLVVTRPTFPAPSVNHIAPSGPAVMSVGRLLAVGVGVRVIAPPVVMRPIALTFVVKSS